MTTPPIEQSLDGPWRVALSEDDLRRRYQETAFDDGDWEIAQVPGHWRRHTAFASNDDPVLYRKTFTTAPAEAHRRQWLVFDGIFYQSDVWLDSVYLGDTEGYFFAHQFEITPMIRERHDHCLSIEVSCTPQRDRVRKRAITGLFQDSDSLDPNANPGGIWRSVRVEESGPIRMLHHRMICAEATTTAATIALRAVLHTEVERTITVRTIVGESDRVEEHRLAAGENRLEWTTTVDQPALWWPWSMGEQPLVDVTIEVCDTDGTVSDRRTRSMGLRSIHLHDWIASINGERMFLKGAGHDPIDYWLAEATADDHRRDLQLAKDAHLDLLRVHAHIGRPELYDAADAMGMLLWQDFPLKWGYHRTIRKQATRQAREAVDLLGHHPSVVMWSAHNEPIPSRYGVGAHRPGETDDDEPGHDDAAPGVPSGFQLAVRQQAPSYNRLVIDRSVAATLRREDGSRPVITRSGMLPNFPRLDGSDNHLSLGWRVGDERQLPALCSAMPRLARFVGEFGSQAVPVDADFIDASSWPDLDWRTLESTYTLRRANLEHFVPTAAFESFEEWAQETRDYQAMVIRFHIETLRRLKYRPTGGFAVSSLADSMPAISTGVLSYDRVPKEGYRALVAACRPVLPIADRLPPHLHGGEPLAIDVHVVSDLRHEIDDAVTVATVEWAGGSHRQSWSGAIDADCCVHVGTVEFEAPDVDGPITLEVELTYGDESVTSRYESFVVTGEHVH